MRIPRVAIRRSPYLAAILSLFVALVLHPADQAEAAALTNVSWTVSNTQTGATSTTYAFSFKTATAGTIKSITMTVPAGTGGTPAVAQNFGVGAGTVALASNTLTYTVT